MSRKGETRSIGREPRRGLEADRDPAPTHFSFLSAFNRLEVGRTVPRGEGEGRLLQGGGGLACDINFCVFFIASILLMKLFEN